MRLSRRSSREQIQIRSARERRRARKALDQAIERAETPGVGETLEIQLVARVSGSASYRTFKEAHASAWRRMGVPFGVGGWPANLEEGDFGVVVLPVTPGRVGIAAGKQPRPIATPVFLTGRPVVSGEFDDIVLAALLAWVESVAKEGPVKLAPPVVEVLQREAVTERRLLDLGRQWTLPRADGI